MIKRENRFKIAAFIFLCFSICFNFKEWIYKYNKYYVLPKTKIINIQPTLITTLISIFFFGGYIIRNVNDIFNDPIRIIFCLIDILFFSGFIAMFSSSETIILGISPQSILLLIVVSMWIGLKSILRYLILIFIAFSASFLGELNKIMGFWGALYILFAFLSFSIQIYINILPNVANINYEFYGHAKKNNDEHQDNKLELKEK